MSSPVGSAPLPGMDPARAATVGAVGAGITGSATLLIESGFRTPLRSALASSGRIGVAVGLGLAEARLLMDLQLPADRIASGTVGAAAGAAAVGAGAAAIHAVL